MLDTQNNQKILCSNHENVTAILRFDPTISRLRPSPPCLRSSLKAQGLRIDR